ncbi:thiolase family protein [Roseibium suaedae]|uniref:Acetyl-CoA C-acetyltransferase n=1 Tax=Roseibium suaedae TaxID=735517 RepID=A0A1M7M6M4_9HYPH|nr:thiolase family protein [Roseibium suaedae]SHM86373.1 acetyl-CoA C-acetyltransferase [Roseibium suaedae]
MRARAVILAAKRTPVAPRGGAFKTLQADELAAAVIKALLAETGLPAEKVDQVIFGNALYGGGNPARMAALRAGLPASIPALTMDTQCCSGLDAILLGCRLIEAGAASCVIAGGMESFSRSPLRAHRPLDAAREPVSYQRPSFAPAPYEDPDLAVAAARLAEERGFSRQEQAAYTVQSHAKALAALALGAFDPELVCVEAGGSANTDRALRRDSYSRQLSQAVALRSPVLAGHAETALLSAATAVEADAAAAVLIASAEFAQSLKENLREISGPMIGISGGLSMGGNPGQPALVPTAAITELMARQGLEPRRYQQLELMEAYAPQAMATLQDLTFREDVVNPEGGALARGHPIGASGAILAVRLFHGLKKNQKKEAGEARGIAAIAAAGGLASVLSLQTEP